MREHTVVLTLGKHALPLQGSAARILAKLNISSIAYKERSLANQDFDFYWVGKKDGTEYRVRGDSWECDKPQTNIYVSVVGANAFASAKLLADKAAEAGWAVKFCEKGTRFDK